MKRLLGAVVLIAASLGVVAATPARAATQNVIAHSTAGYANPAVVIEEGDSLDFVNADPLGVPHNVVEDMVDPPRFASATVAGGVTTPVVGVETLPAGTYLFFCDLHAWMKGSLQVVPDGTLPVDPPPIAPPSGDGGAPVVALAGGIVPTPTSIDATDTHLYIASYAQGAVVRAPFLAEGLLGAPETVATGFTNPLGVVVGDDGTVFVADSHAGGDAYGGRTVGRVQAVDPATGAADVVVDGLPNGRHNTNNLAIHGDRLYITNGNSTDDGINGGDPELPLSGTLVSVPLSARGIVVGADGTAPDGLQVEAVGMRNVYDVAIRPGTNEGWMTVNGPDTFDPYGEDTLVRVDDLTANDSSVSSSMAALRGRDGVRGRLSTTTTAAPPDFGFPECLYAADGTILDNPVTPGTCGPHEPPEELLGLHVSANGIAFGPDDSTWGGDAFIALFGNFFGSSVVGHKVVRVPIDTTTGESGPPQDAIPGVLPLDLAFGPAGLYVADFAGVITLYRAPLL